MQSKTIEKMARRWYRQDMLATVWVRWARGKEESSVFPSFCLGPLDEQHVQERTSLKGKL